jgi:hypothetical protein
VLARPAQGAGRQRAQGDATWPVCTSHVDLGRRCVSPCTVRAGRPERASARRRRRAQNRLPLGEIPRSVDKTVGCATACPPSRAAGGRRSARVGDGCVCPSSPSPAFWQHRPLRVRLGGKRRLPPPPRALRDCRTYTRFPSGPTRRLKRLCAPNHRHTRARWARFDS